MSKTTLDLSTLSDITDGAHTVKVKAKASGYNDSEFSNEISYTKASAPTYSGNIRSSTTKKISIAGIWGVKNGSKTKIVNGGSLDSYGEDVSGYTEYDIALGSVTQRFSVSTARNCTYYAHDSYNFRIVPSADSFIFSFYYNA